MQWSTEHSWDHRLHTTTEQEGWNTPLLRSWTSWSNLQLAYYPSNTSMPIRDLSQWSSKHDLYLWPGESFSSQFLGRKSCDFPSPFFGILYYNTRPSCTHCIFSYRLVLRGIPCILLLMLLHRNLVYVATCLVPDTLWSNRRLLGKVNTLDCRVSCISNSSQLDSLLIFSFISQLRSLWFQSM